jgi:hypothetical protein
MDRPQRLSPESILRIQEKPLGEACSRKIHLSVQSLMELRESRKSGRTDFKGASDPTSFELALRPRSRPNHRVRSESDRERAGHPVACSEMRPTVMESFERLWPRR